MVFPIVGGDGKPTGYDVDNSLRINAGDSAFLSRTQTAGNQRTFTVSAWVKRARLNDRQALFSSTTDGSNECFIWFDTNDELFVIGSGTGFFVNKEGYIVTNEHVAGICQSLASYINGETHLFRIIALDKKNDLALLRGEYRNKKEYRKHEYGF